MKLIEETFTDINGRKFRRNTVRSSGDGSFLTLDKLHGSALGREAVCSARATGAAAGSERANQRLEAGGGTGSFASFEYFLLCACTCHVCSGKKDFKFIPSKSQYLQSERLVSALEFGDYRSLF